MKTIEDKVKNKVQKFHDLEAQLMLMENELSKNKTFREFITLQKEVNKKAVEVWSEISDVMITANKKRIETDWVLLTIVEKKNLDIDEDALAKQFTKVVPDTKAINDYIKENKTTPRGVTQVDAPYLRKTFRNFVS